ncbi:MAG TPA: nickel ABC transporter substrate-binding protein [Patescibacteria group bacterium]|nr:nickel ABC transporter substrate-binding protein [Patescibacteria group bacterium]
MTILCIALLCLALAGCGGKPDAAKPAKTQLTYASTKDIRNINPHLYSGEMAAQNMVFESLVINTDKGVEPCLAEKWEVSSDGKEYTFYLRKDVKFTDGTPFNAEAVKLNIEAIIANKMRHAWLDMVNQIDHGEVINEFTYKLVLKQPYYPTLEELALTRPFRFISPKCFVNGGTKDGVNGYVGTGPWVLSEHQANQYAVFTANKNYWGAKPKLDSVKWKVMPDHQTIILALQKGEVDLLFGADGDMIDLDSFKALEKEGKYKAIMSNPVASRAILLNAHQPVTSDKKVREALQYAVNKKAITDGILNGSEAVANTLMSPTVPYCNVPLTTRAYDPEKTRQLLTAAGWVMGADNYRHKDGKVCEITIYFNSNNAQERTISEYMQSDLKAVGVKLNIAGEEKQAFLDRQRSGIFDLQYSLSWGTPYDPQSYISSWRIPAHGDYQAQVGIEKKEWVDATVGKILVEHDKTKRQLMYNELLTYIHDECVYLPISYSRTKAVYVPALKGVTFNPSQYEIAFEKMYF